MTNSAGPETKEQERDRKLRELEGKNVAHYSTMLGAFLQTKMERDKMLITLSAIGVGLLVTLLTTVGVQRRWEIWLYAAALLCFLATIAAMVAVLGINSRFIEEQLRQSNSTSKLKLRRLDRLSLVSFIVAGVFVVAIGIASGVNHFLSTGGADMPEDRKSQTFERGVRSLLGIENLRPEELPQEVDDPAAHEDDAAETQPSDDLD